MKNIPALLLLLVISVAHAETDATSPNADIKFKKVNAKIGKENVMVEIADDDAKREHGLMYRKELKDGAGMLFIFDDVVTRSFWMKNTLIPLDIGYFDKNKVLIDIQNMEPASPMDEHPPVYTSKGPAKYALELPSGWFKKHHVELKSHLDITRP